MAGREPQSTKTGECPGNCQIVALKFPQIKKINTARNPVSALSQIASIVRKILALHIVDLSLTSRTSFHFLSSPEVICEHRAKSMFNIVAEVIA